MKALTNRFEIITSECSVCFSTYTLRTYDLACMRDRRIGMENQTSRARRRPDTKSVFSENRFSVARSLVMKGCKAQQSFRENIIFREFELNICNVVTYLYTFIFLEYLIASSVGSFVLFISFLSTIFYWKYFGLLRVLL